MTTISLLLFTAALSAQAPNDAEQDRLAKEYFALDLRSDQGRVRQPEILERPELAPELTSEKEKRWRQELAKLAAKGTQLVKKSGRHFFWDKEKPERGLYIIGGDTEKPKGLLIGMHGGGAGAGDAGSAQGAFESAAKKLELLAIFPEVLEKTEHGWTDSGTEEWVIDLIAAARRTWKLDSNRIYFTGHSMGGYGTWMLGAHHADMVAGLAPSAGAPTPLRERDKGIVDIIEGVIPCLRNVPLAVYQSDDDPQVPPDTNRVAVKKLEEAKQKWGGFPFEYWEANGQGHSLPPGGAIALLAKVGDKKRDPRPARLVWQPALRWKQQFAWLWWQKPIGGALVVADLDKARNAVAVTCDKDASGLEVLLDERMFDPKQDFVITLNGKETYRGKPKHSLSTLLMTGVRNDPELTFAMRVPVAH